MKKIIAIIFILSCFLNPNLRATSNERLFKKIRSSFSNHNLKKKQSKSKSYSFKKELSDESFQVIFSEEPNEFYYKFSEKAYQSIISELSEWEDDDYEDDDEFYPNIDYDLLFPKESHLSLVFDENLESFHFLSVSRLQKSQDHLAEALSTFLADWKKYYESNNEDYMDSWEEEHLEYTPITKDENGNYTTELFYSYTSTDFFDDEDDEYDEEEEEEEEYAWGKIVITKKNLYHLLFYSIENTSQMNNKASKFLTSFEVNND